MVKNILQWVVELFMPVSSFAAERNPRETTVMRISVMPSGKVLLDRDEATIGEMKKALESIKAKGGAVWYYRESGKGDPPAEAIEVFKLIVESKLPVSLSTIPDFSDYVDEEGRSQPRR
jgi:hypothetical protein